MPEAVNFVNADGAAHDWSYERGRVDLCYDVKTHGSENTAKT